MHPRHLLCTHTSPPLLVIHWRAALVPSTLLSLSLSFGLFCASDWIDQGEAGSACCVDAQPKQRVLLLHVPVPPHARNQGGSSAGQQHARHGEPACNARAPVG